MIWNISRHYVFFLNFCTDWGNGATFSPIRVLILKIINFKTLKKVTFIIFRILFYKILNHSLDSELSFKSSTLNFIEFFQFKNDLSTQNQISSPIIIPEIWVTQVEWVKNRLMVVFLVIGWSNFSKKNWTKLKNMMSNFLVFHVKLLLKAWLLYLLFSNKTLLVFFFLPKEETGSIAGIGTSTKNDCSNKHLTIK